MKKKPHQTKGKLKTTSPSFVRCIEVFDSFAASDQADREYWWSRTPAARLRALKQLRQMNYGYGNSKPLPRFEPILQIKKMGEDWVSDNR